MKTKNIAFIYISAAHDPRQTVSNFTGFHFISNHLMMKDFNEDKILA